MNQENVVPLPVASKPTRRRSERKIKVEPPKAPVDNDVLSGTPYRTVRQIGDGGHGDVFEAEHRELRRHVAVKVAQEGVCTIRFRAEAMMLATIEHPNLTRVLDLGYTAAGRMYFAMDLLEGWSLEKYLSYCEKDNRHVTPDQALLFMRHLLSAVAAIHRVGVVHGDIKPMNIFVVTGEKKAVLLDVGSAAPMEPDSLAASLLMKPDTRNVRGTATYQAPEALTDDFPTPQWDIYSLGIVMFEMLAGERVFGETIFVGESASKMHNRFYPAPLTDRYEDMEDVWPLVERAIKKSPTDRFASVAEFEDAVRRVQMKRWKEREGGSRVVDGGAK